MRVSADQDAEDLARHEATDADHDGLVSEYVGGPFGAIFCRLRAYAVRIDIRGNDCGTIRPELGHSCQRRRGGLRRENNSIQARIDEARELRMRRRQLL